MSTAEEEELEKGLIGGTHSDEAVAAEPENRKKCTQFKLVCDKCSKEFDSSATGADPILGLCSLCKAGASNEEDPSTSNEEEIQQDSDADNSEDPMNTSTLAVTAVEDVMATEEDSTAIDDDELEDEALPDTTGTVDQEEEIDNYTGFNSGQEIGATMKAAKIGQQPFSAKLGGNLGMQEFHQNRDPEDYLVEGKHGYRKLLKDPYARPSKYSQG